MAIKKSALYSSIWSSCDELRGGMDASQYKDYVLVLLFMKYVSDKHAGQRNALVEVPPGASYDDILALKGDKEIGDKINKIIARLAEANDLKGVIDQADFNDDGKLGRGKEMVDRLSNLVAIFDKPELDFRKNRAEDDDLLGDAYEYLMKNFATESGKSKGQFYTPAEVSRVMAQVIGVGSATSASQTIYDPTCGSGSLLIKAHDEALAKTGYDLTLYGQEMDNATYALARMNMILHGCATADIGKGNTLSNPLFRQGDTTLKTFDFVVANPPFSNKAWSSGLNPAEDVFGRFALGIPPKKNGDYAFLLHVLASMKSTGKGAIVMPHGVLFRGNVEAEIRRNVVKRGYIKGIIGLPANLFYGTGIPACIVVLDKENAFVRKGVFMIDASKGFIKDGNKNRLRAQDIYKIVSVFNDQVEVPGYSHMATFDEIEQNDFNLNIPRYIDSTEPEDLQDIDAHLNGGIPDRDIDDLERYWAVFPSLRTELFEPADRPGYSQLQVPASDIRSTIFGHPEFEAFNESVMALFEEWRAAHVRKLKDLGPGVSPKALISELSESLLNMFLKQRVCHALTAPLARAGKSLS
jgi:type I restriction enzyme M protein